LIQLSISSDKGRQHQLEPERERVLMKIKTFIPSSIAFHDSSRL